MAKALRVVGTVAAVVAIVAAPFSPAVAAIASAVAAVANAGAMALQKRPGAIGAINQVVIGANMPVPYAVGRTYVAGNQVYDNSGGASNRYRFNVNVLTAAGPIDSYEKILADFATQGFITDPEQGGSHMKATGFYSDFMWHKRQLGNRPETTALIDGNTPMPQWGSANKLSGYAAMLFVMKFDKDAKRYTGGVPQLGAVGKWVKIYDPRKDSTYPGGSGGHRWNDESTWEWSENPALHALTYARGRFIEKTAAGAPLVPPVKLLGCGFPFEAIDVAAFVEGANLCEANGWTCGGIVYEAPGTNKWENLKRFCQSFAAQPALAGGRLGLKLFAPRPSLFTLTADDLADGGIELRAMKPFQERRNSIVPRFRSEGHRWDYVQGDAVTISTYVADDGELRSEEVQYDLCQDKDQAAELAAADLIMGRQFGPLNVTVKPWMMRYRPGEAGDVNLPELGLNNRRMVIVARQIDPATGAVTFTMESEPTLEEYAFALGRTGTAPPTPVIRAPGEIDEIAADLTEGTVAVSNLIRDSSAANLTFSVASDGKVTLSNHNRVYLDKTVTVTGVTDFATGAEPGDLVFIYYDDPARAGGAVTYHALVVPGGVGPTEEASVSPDHPYRHMVAVKSVPATGSSGGGTDAGAGGGGPAWWKLESSTNDNA